MTGDDIPSSVYVSGFITKSRVSREGGGAWVWISLNHAHFKPPKRMRRRGLASQYRCIDFLTGKATVTSREPAIPHMQGYVNLDIQHSTRPAWLWIVSMKLEVALLAVKYVPIHFCALCQAMHTNNECTCCAFVLLFYKTTVRTCIVWQLTACNTARAQWLEFIHWSSKI